MEKNETDEQTRLSMARAFLSGFIVEDANNLPTRRYFEPGSADEKIARKALAEILLSGRVSMEILTMLAALVAPSGMKVGTHPWISSDILLSEIADGRHFVARNRREGRPKADVTRDSEIYRRVANLRRAGESKDVAIELVAKETGLGTDQVGRIFKARYWVWKMGL